MTKKTESEKETILKLIDNQIEYIQKTGSMDHVKMINDLFVIRDHITNSHNCRWKELLTVVYCVIKIIQAVIDND